MNAIVPALHKKFTTAQYHQMAETGILTDRDRVELIAGEIIQMAAIGKRHATCVGRLNQVFARSLPPNALVRVQDPVHLSDYSEPQPDLAIVREGTYLTEHPGPQDVFALALHAVELVALEKKLPCREAF